MLTVGHKADPGKEGRAVPQEHDGQACQLCGAVSHLARPLPGLRGDWGTPLLCEEAVLS